MSNLTKLFIPTGDEGDKRVLGGKGRFRVERKIFKFLARVELRGQILKVRWDFLNRMPLEIFCREIVDRGLEVCIFEGFLDAILYS